MRTAGIGGVEETFCEAGLGVDYEGSVSDCCGFVDSRVGERLVFEVFLGELKRADSGVVFYPGD